MFMYGSIFIAVTFRPVAFKSSPVEEAGETQSALATIKPRFLKRTDDTLPNTTHHATRHEDVLHFRCALEGK